ncbi:TcfC E-set like domain-containing protein [Achromobacter sp. ACM03]|uniref:TcfC E-set like domain-containing protein n=1 Tax=Achromobacter sp. ACM03 TaxID=2769300 RepID=UPI00177E46A7|nr:TcfC E-set like domain-containing protein [Achromobacter sp. ACM03]MBD9431823.1 TcfC E-set like domain-containing protein [Achromobacter sp. ACM03]
MHAHRAPRRLKKLLFCMLSAATAQVLAQTKISYGIPEGFSAIEMDNSASYVSTFNGKTLPGLIVYSAQQNQLTFDPVRYAENGVTLEEVDIIRKVVSAIDYKRCVNGCDLRLAEHYVAIDKVRRTLQIRSSRDDYLSPATTWGLINNQSLDLRGSSDSYRSANISGSTWLGLPLRSFGYMSWYGSRNRMRGQSSRNQGISSYFLQKNFHNTYVRAGKQNSLDYASGSVSTLLSPSFDQFVTIGSQDHLRAEQDTGSLVLYSTAEGNYEFYRNGRLVLKRPAILGRNEISYIDLPGGYYPVEIRLVDRNGNLINRETRDINNLNFSGGGRNSWHMTAGKEMGVGGQLYQAAFSRNLSQFYLNASFISGDQSRWAGEINATRPGRIGTADLTPTVGLLGGERGAGGYFNLSMNDPVLGSATLSRYQNNNVSRFYWGAPSTSFSYSRSLGKVVANYNYNKHSRGEVQQTEVRWSYRPNGLWSTFSLGVQKNGYGQGAGGYAVYFNMSWTLDKTQASFRAARQGDDTQLSGDYRKDFQDSYGSSTAGVTVNRSRASNSVNIYGNRSGTRGDTSLSLGHSDYGSNADFSYRGMLAASAEGVALGRYSNGGSAMMLETPNIEGTAYGFSVEGHPVAGGSTYAVPLNNYRDLPFAQVLSNNEHMDMNIEVPANVVRAHPGQVYAAQAKVAINMIYSGILLDASGKPVGGKILETGDTAFPNGLFSVASKSVLRAITVEQSGQRHNCDLTNTFNGSYYRCR